eukprot:g3330.t1
MRAAPIDMTEQSDTNESGGCGEVMHDAALEHLKSIRNKYEATEPERYRQDSFDHVSPAFGHVSRKMKKHSAVFSLVSTILGGGVLSLPYAMSKTGVIGGPLLIIICAAISDFSLDLLLLSARYGSAVETFEEVAKKAFGRRAQIMTVFLLFTLTWVCCVAYAVLIGDMFAPLVTYAIPGVTISSDGWNRKLLVVICSAAVAPLGMFRSLNALRFTSAFCVCSVALLAICIAIRSIKRGVVFSNHDAHDFGHVRYWPESFADVLSSLPIYFVSYLCHFNVLSTHCEMKQPSRARVKNVIHITISSCTFLYILAGIMGYLYRLDGTCGDILQNFSTDDVLINIGRLALALTLVLSTPLLVLPCRNAFYRLCMMVRHDCSKRKFIDISSPSFQNLRSLDEQEEEGTDGSSIVAIRSISESGSRRSSRMDPTPLLHESENRTSNASPSKYTSVVIDAEKLQMSSKLRCVIALGISASSLIAACIIPNIVTVWSFLGSTIGVIIAFIFPAVCYIKITSHKSFHLYQLLAGCLLVFSVLVMIGSTYEAVL